MSTQYRLMQSGKTASGGCSADQGSSEPVAPRIIQENINHESCISMHDTDSTVTVKYAHSFSATIVQSDNKSGFAKTFFNHGWKLNLNCAVVCDFLTQENPHTRQRFT
jgi:hypothetical protein